MIRMIAYATTEEQNCFRQLIGAISMQYSWADCELLSTNRIDDLKRWLEENNPIDAFICDVVDATTIPLLKSSRKKHPHTMIIPIADFSVSPAVYVQPDILPYALFWRPVSIDSIQETMIRILSTLRLGVSNNEEQSFTISTKQQLYQIPFRDIFYFEARNKRIYLRVLDHEIAFYDTLSKLEKRLQSRGFLRCHKSFLVNREHILTIDKKNNMILLNEKIAVPVSRSYRSSCERQIL